MAKCYLALVEEGTKKSYLRTAEELKKIIVEVTDTNIKPQVMLKYPNFEADLEEVKLILEDSCLSQIRKFIM